MPMGKNGSLPFWLINSSAKAEDEEAEEIKVVVGSPQPGLVFQSKRRYQPLQKCWGFYEQRMATSIQYKRQHFGPVRGSCMQEAL